MKRVTEMNGNRANGIRGCRITIWDNNSNIIDRFVVPSMFGGVNYCKKYPNGIYGKRFYNALKEIPNTGIRGILPVWRIVMFRTYAYILKLDANYTNGVIDREFTEVSNEEIQFLTKKSSKEKPLTPLQFKFGDMFTSNIYLDGDEYINTEDGLVPIEEIIQ